MVNMALAWLERPTRGVSSAANTLTPPFARRSLADLYKIVLLESYINSFLAILVIGVTLT
jgi:hypothetical protein